MKSHDNSNVDFYEKNLPKVFSDINKCSYNNTLHVVNIIESVHCREWNLEKKFILEHDKYKTEIYKNKLNLNAKRYYVEIRKKSSEGKQNSDPLFLHHGHIDFRPLEHNPSISDAYLPIPEEPNFFVTCKKIYKSDDPNGDGIKTVPYMYSDNNIIWCSVSSLWIILTTLANKLGLQHPSIYDIILNTPDRVGTADVKTSEFQWLLKKIGYSYYYYRGQIRDEEIKDIKEKCNGLYQNVDGKKCPLYQMYNFVNDFDIDPNSVFITKKILYAYIESEIPIYLIFNLEHLYEEYLKKGYLETLPSKDNNKTGDTWHAVVAIGHTLDTNMELSDFIIHDVSKAPFLKISSDFVENKLVDALVILPENVIDYRSAAVLYDELLKEIKTDPQPFGIHKVEEEKSRPYLIKSQRIKFWFITNKFLDLKIRNIISKANFPNYVWVFEYINTKNNVYGYLVIDANKPESDKIPKVVFVLFPKYVMWQDTKEKLHQRKRTKNSFFVELPKYRST